MLCIVCIMSVCLECPGVNVQYISHNAMCSAGVNFMWDEKLEAMIFNNIFLAYYLLLHNVYRFIFFKKKIVGHIQSIVSILQ